MILLDCAWHVPPQTRSFFPVRLPCVRSDILAKHYEGLALGGRVGSAKQALRSAEQARRISTGLPNRPLM